MSNPELRGLVLTRTERLIVVALSYLFCAPLVWTNGKKLISYIYGTTAEARRQVREERQRQEGEGGEAAPAAAG